ncbi:RDD family protein [Nonomuraea thailandensis]
MARLIDGVIFGVVMWVVSLALTPLYPSYSSITGLTSGLTFGMLYYLAVAIVVTLIYTAYDFVLVKLKGQTVGKMVMGIKVAQVGGAVPPEGLPNDVSLKRALVTVGGFVVYWVPLVGPLISAIAYGLNGASQLWDKPCSRPSRTSSRRRWW